MMTSETESKSGGKKLDAKARVDEVISRHKAMKHLNMNYPWFANLMVGVIENKLELSTGFMKVGTHDLTNRQAKVLGAGESVVRGWREERKIN